MVFKKGTLYKFSGLNPPMGQQYVVFTGMVKNHHKDISFYEFDFPNGGWLILNTTSDKVNQYQEILPL